MSTVDSFISAFGGLTEEYLFYNGEVCLHYEPRAHRYLLAKDGDLIPQEGVTNVCHVIDKSEALIPWACKQQAGYLLNHAGVTLPDGNRILRSMTWQEFENLVLASKTAHKDALEDAGDVGHIAHAWIERYIKAVLYYGAASMQVQELLARFPADDRATNCCLAALDWMRNHNVRWLGTERKVYSRKYGYAGTMDGLCLVDSCSNHHCCKTPFWDRLTISDWKTSNYLYVEHLYQTSAYMQAYNEETEYVNNDAPLVRDRWIIRLGKEDAEFDPWHAPVEDFRYDFSTFTTALELKRRHEATQKRVRDRMAQTREDIRAERRAAKEAAEKAEKERKAQEREKARQEREAALKIKCKKADDYKGIRKPSCGCETCAKKYAEVQAAKESAKPDKKTKKRGKRIKPCDGNHPGPACGFMCWLSDPPIGCRYQDIFPQLCLPAPKPQLLLQANNA